MEKINDFESNYIIEFDDGTIYPLEIVTGVSLQNNNSIIKYETIGGYGGYVVNTGPLIVEIPVTFILKNDLRTNLRIYDMLRKITKPFKLFSKLGANGLFGKYIISSINSNIVDGQESMQVDLTLVEYRSAEIEKINLVLPTDKSVESLLNYLKNQNLIDIKR